ncbi:MAG: zinc ribbon domain-containing protein [Candidatus Margulisbacteria bacterium]|nr:zinc ribbon domain-containing protein [Candidatus Margulisiibacteriota bacterium]
MNVQALICQSCAMPMQKEEDFGTNADNSKNKEYCHFCFKDGQFTDPDLTMEKQIEKMAGMAAKMNIAEDKARAMAQNILPNLKRWKT